MAISFIPVRDQLSIIQTSHEVAKQKGEVLKRLSTGKKLFNSGDGIEEFSKIQRMKKDVYEYETSIKNVTLAKSLLETALEVTDLLYDQYSKLSNKINEIPTDLLTTWTGTEDEIFDQSLRKQLQSDIDVSIEAITNILETRLDSKRVLTDDGSPIKLVISEKEGISVNVDLTSLKINDDATASKNTTNITLSDFKKLIYDEAGTGAKLGHYEDFIDSLASPAPATEKNTLYERLSNASKTSYNNYNIILTSIESLSNIENLSYVKKANTEAAISAMEDVDIQEEMVNLMQTQILEELSAEALKAIKDSARFVIRLVKD